MIKLLIFDFDGLLVDSEPIYVNSNKRFLAENGIKDFSIVDRLFGMRAEEAFALMKSELNLQGTVEELMNARNEYILDDFEQGKLKLMPNLTEVLDILKNKFSLSIGSSSKKILLDKALALNKFDHYFSEIVCGDDVVYGKPQPDIFLKVAEKFKLNPSECLVLEDAPNGILAAKRAGMMTIAIPNEHTKNLTFPDPDFIVNNLKEALVILENINDTDMIIKP